MPVKRKQVSAGSEAELVMKTIVIGLGNPILGDDGVGWKVAEKIEQQLCHDQSVVVECLSLGGISLMEHLIGYQRAILIDAFNLDEPLGSILILKLSELPNYSAFHVTSVHDTSLQNAIELGRSMGAELPDDVTVVGISTKPIYDFGESLSPQVAAAVSQAAQIVLSVVKQAAEV
jgi:hydrogenase maturation protease